MERGDQSHNGSVIQWSAGTLVGTSRSTWKRSEKLQEEVRRKLNLEGRIEVS